MKSDPKNNLNLKFVTGVACFIGAVSPAFGAGPSGSAATSRLLEEVVVTAQKREENLGDVPISVSAYSNEKLEALGVTGPTELPQLTPGLQYDSLVGYSLVYLRGVGTDQFLPNGDASVTTYIDGIYTPLAHGLAQDFVELQRVEILKGPQGTLFGRNSTGGAINIVTAKPEQEWYAHIAYTASDFNSEKVKAHIAGPITENFRISLSGLYSENDSYYQRPSGSIYHPFPRENSKGLNLKLDYSVTENLDLSLSAFSTRQRGLSSVVVSSLDVKPLWQGIIPESPRPYVTDPDLPINFMAENDMAYGQAVYRMDRMDIKLLGSYQDVTTWTLFDFEGSSAPVINFNPKDQGATFTTAELQFQSNENSWMSERLNWIAGYYYFKSDDAGFRNLDIQVAETVVPSLASELLTLLNSVAGNLPGAGLSDGIELNNVATVNTEANAIFAQATFDINDWVGLTLGGRYQEEVRTLTGSSIAVENADDSRGMEVINYPRREQRTENFSPKVTLDFKLFDDTLAFASWQRGFKSGTFNIINIQAEPGEVTPETLTSIEFGVKGSFLDGRLKYNAAVFQNHIEDQQVLVISLQSSGAVSIENAGEAEISGADFDIIYQPFPVALAGFVITAGGAFLDGEYLSYPDATGFDQQTGLVRDKSLDFTGNTTVRTPEETYNIGLNYSFNIFDGVTDAGVNYYSNSGYYFDAQNVAEQDDYAVVNAHLAFDYEPMGLRVAVHGKNLNGEEYFYNKFQTDFNTVGTYAPPKTIGVSVDWKFQ